MAPEDVEQILDSAASETKTAWSGEDGAYTFAELAVVILLDTGAVRVVEEATGRSTTITAPDELVTLCASAATAARTKRATFL